MDNNQCLNTYNFIGDASLSTQIGYLQLNISVKTNNITSIDGVIPIPFAININKMNLNNYPEVILHLDSDKELNNGIGYNFNFSGKTYYDKDNKYLIIGDLIGNNLVKIGENSYAVVSNLKNDCFKLNSIIIQEIEIPKNFTFISSKANKIDFNFETIDERLLK